MKGIKRYSDLFKYYKSNTPITSLVIQFIKIKIIKNGVCISSFIFPYIYYIYIVIYLYSNKASGWRKYIIYSTLNYILLDVCFVVYIYRCCTVAEAYALNRPIAT